MTDTAHTLARLAQMRRARAEQALRAIDAELGNAHADHRRLLCAMRSFDDTGRGAQEMRMAIISGSLSNLVKRVQDCEKLISTLEAKRNIARHSLLRAHFSETALARQDS